MSKFNVGDKVRILDGSQIPNYLGGFTESMNSLIGDEATVVDVCSYRSKHVYLLDDKLGYIFDERGLELIKETDVIEVKRYAHEGEWVKIVASRGYACNKYRNGDIVKVIVTGNDGDVVFRVRKSWDSMCGGEYVVLENYQPPKEF